MDVPEYGTPVFGVPGLPVDEILLAAEQPRITSDEFSAGTAALAFYLLTGRPGRAVAMAGPGTDLLSPAVAMARREGAQVLIDDGSSTAIVETPPSPWPYGRKGRDGDPIVLLGLCDWADWPAAVEAVRRTGLAVVTANPALPGGAWFSDQWLGHLGYQGHLRASQAVRTRPVLRHHELRDLPDGSARPIPRIQPPGATLPEEEIAWELDAVLPPEAPVVVDAGTAHAAVARTIAWHGKRSVCSTAGLTTMGWSLGAVLGAHAARPTAPVGVMVGDGSLLMRLGDLAVLARYQVPALIVVLVNGLLGSDRGQTSMDGEWGIARLPEVDWVAAVGAMGVGVCDRISEAASCLDKGPQLVLMSTRQGAS